MQQIQFNLEDDPIDYILVFDFNQIVDAEQVAGCNLLSAIASIWSMTATQMRGMLYALLKTKHPDVLLKEAGELLTRDSGIVMTALAKALGAEDPPPPGPPPRDAAPPVAE